MSDADVTSMSQVLGLGQTQEAIPGVPSQPAQIINPSAPSPAPAFSWLPELTDPESVGYVQNKGWSKPEDVLNSYRNLEKLIGQGKEGRTVVLPAPESSEQEVSDFFTRLGKPEKPEGYSVAIESGTDTTFAKEASDMFYQLNLTKEQGDGVAKWYNDKLQAQKHFQDTNAKETLQKEIEEVRREWGAAYDVKKQDIKNAVGILGWSDETVNKAAAIMGHKGFMHFMDSIVTKTGSKESPFIQGSSKDSGIMTPEQARYRIAELKKDAEFQSRFIVRRDANAIAEMARLHEYAYPNMEE